MWQALCGAVIQSFSEFNRRKDKASRTPPNLNKDSCLSILPSRRVNGIIRHTLTRAGPGLVFGMAKDKGTLLKDGRNMSK